MNRKNNVVPTKLSSNFLKFLILGAIATSTTAIVVQQAPRQSFAIANEPPRIVQDSTDRPIKGRSHAVEETDFARTRTGVSIDGIDHFVLTVRDLDTTIDFYTNLLGMEEVTFGQGRKALHFGQQKINLHEAGREFEPKATVPMPGSADLCFITSTPVEEVAERLQAAGVEVLEGPVERTGAVGRISSIYFRDPDGNLLEVSNYMD